MSSFGVVLDTCILYSAPIRDTLLRAASEGLYSLHWTDDILAELRHSLVESGRVTVEQAQRLAGVIAAQFPEARVTNHKELIDIMTNDPKDRHVLAAAVASASQVIVTNNLRDFPASALERYNIQSQTADEFLRSLFDLAPDDMTQIVIDQAADLHKPAMTVEELLAVLEKQVPTFVRHVRAEIGIGEFNVRRLKVEAHIRVRFYDRTRTRKSPPAS